VPAIRALADQPVLVIATTGDSPRAAVSALGGTVPANVRLEQFVPYAELMPHVDALVTNGGYGTVQQALSNGVPIVVAGATEDKPEVAARIAWSGAGIRIRSQSPAPGQLAGSVRSVLEQPRFRERAAAIAKAMREYDAPSTAATLLEDLARSPITLSPGLTNGDAGSRPLAAAPRT
jgi:UDP:flavonoid glycosyltransferase YjiC (YdhE family)